MSKEKTRMIIHSAVCDHCGTQTDIDKKTNSFQVVLKSYALSQHGFNDTFGNSWSNIKSKPLSMDQIDWVNSTFCDRDCFMDYVKHKMNDNGTFQVSKEELQKIEDDNESDGVKELKRVAKQLNDLEFPPSGPYTGGGAHAKSK